MNDNFHIDSVLFWIHKYEMSNSLSDSCICTLSPLHNPFYDFCPISSTLNLLFLTACCTWSGQSE